MSKHQPPQQPKIVHRPAAPQQQAAVPSNEAAKEEVAPQAEARKVLAYAFIRVPGKGWTAITYTIQGDRVLKVDAKEPDIKPIAQENFRRAVARTLLGEDEG